ncbi:MAG: phosphatidylserine decarboxylase [Alphaproteobacteria bacterium]|nr:phosphatidylserine decarboxylase [Alphaproteobacteria bacterium]
MEVLTSIFAPIHREGHRFIAIFAAITLLFFLIYDPLGWVGVLLTCWCAYFFRDPARVTPQRGGLIISPADGVVSAIAQVPPPVELDMPEPVMTRISVFMNVFNCHVNRIPIDATVTRTAYTPGLFFNASLDKASEDNERNAVCLTTEDGVRLAVVQIAGLVARRIISWASVDQKMKTGERFGMIRFGSRVDVYLPEGVAPLVALGQTMIAGETVLADLSAHEPARHGQRS